jgi:hypothetical protein
LDNPKRCPRCLAAKSLTDFGRDRKRQDGRFSWCLACKAAHQRAWRTGARILRDNLRHRIAYRLNPDRFKAHVYVSRALKAGTLVKPAACEDCGGTQRPLEAHHHHGYARAQWYDVAWVCRSCHQIRHRRIEQQQQQAA